MVVLTGNHLDTSIRLAQWLYYLFYAHRSYFTLNCSLTVGDLPSKHCLFGQDLVMYKGQILVHRGASLSMSAFVMPMGQIRCYKLFVTLAQG